MTILAKIPELRDFPRKPWTVSSLPQSQYSIDLDGTEWNVLCFHSMTNEDGTKRRATQAEINQSSDVDRVFDFDHFCFRVSDYAELSRLGDWDAWADEYLHLMPRGVQGAV